MMQLLEELLKEGPKIHVFAHMSRQELSRETFLDFARLNQSFRRSFGFVSSIRHAFGGL